MQAKSRLIVALDVPTLPEALPLIEQLAPYVGCFKIGLELITAVGAPRLVETIHQRGGKIFFDAKFSDIPNTVASASREIAKLGVEFFDVHASCGEEGLRAAVENRGKSNVLAVTVLTSMDANSSKTVFGDEPVKKVVQFARLAQKAGVQGIVCSPKELAELAQHSDLKSLKRVTPGIRPEWAAVGDQKRVMTPKEAVLAGADYLVIGRPITQPPSSVKNPVEAAQKILSEIQEAGR